MNLSRDIAEIVAIYARTVEHLAASAAALTQSGHPGPGIQLASIAADFAVLLARVIDKGDVPPPIGRMLCDESSI